MNRSAGILKMSDILNMRVRIRGPTLVLHACTYAHGPYITCTNNNHETTHTLFTSSAHYLASQSVAHRYKLKYFVGSSIMEANTEILRKQVMVSQFVNAVGCSPDEATQILTSARWQLEVRSTCLISLISKITRDRVLRLLETLF